MKTATIRQVRNDFGTVLGWINAGEEVTILKRRQPVARLLPPPFMASRRPVVWVARLPVGLPLVWPWVRA